MAGTLWTDIHTCQILQRSSAGSTTDRNWPRIRGRYRIPRTWYHLPQGRQACCSPDCFSGCPEEPSSWNGTPVAWFSPWPGDRPPRSLRRWLFPPWTRPNWDSSKSAQQSSWDLGLKDDLIAANNSWTVTIPATVAPGNHVLRHEIIAPHSAGTKGWCAEPSPAHQPGGGHWGGSDNPPPLSCWWYSWNGNSTRIQIREFWSISTRNFPAMLFPVLLCTLVRMISSEHSCHLNLVVVCTVPWVREERKGSAVEVVLISILLHLPLFPSGAKSDFCNFFATATCCDFRKTHFLQDQRDFVHHSVAV